jgi:hypothetical protein
MRDELKQDMESRIQGNKTDLRSWMIILAIAILFFCYGLFMFLAVGDKGPPGWDFGVVKDIPGESAYSTHPPGAPEPEPQHVSQKPPQVLNDLQKEKP